VQGNFGTAYMHPESGTWLDLVVSAPSRLGAILGRSQGLLRCVDCGRSGLGSDVKHNKSEFQRGLIYYFGLYFHKQLLVCLGVLGFCLLPPTV